MALASSPFSRSPEPVEGRSTRASLGPPFDRLRAYGAAHERSLTVWGTALLAAALFLLTRRYIGIWHDARLYTFLAEARLDPANFAQDLFVRHGGQDSFTLFTPLYAAAIRALTLPVAYPLLLLAGQALWLSGLWAFTRARLLRGAPAALALLLAAGATGAYGAYDIFHSGEMFLTPRLWAEALTLHALAARRWPVAAGLLLAAAALHPIMALAGVAVLVLAAGLDRPRLFAALAPLLLIPAALALLQVKPFSALFTTVDPVWREALVARVRYLLPSWWRFADWANFAAALAVVATAAAVSAGPRRRLLAAVAIVAAGGVAVTWAFGDRLGSLFVLQAQLWRGAWLLGVLAGPAIVVTALALRRHPAMLPAAALMLPVLVGPWEIWTLALPLAGCALALATAAGRAPVLAPPLRWALVIMGVAVFAAAGFGHTPGELWGAVAPDKRNFTQMAALGALAAAAFVLAVRKPPLLALLSAGTLIFAVASWDIRTPWARATMHGPWPAGIALPRGRDVLWGDDADGSWFILGRPNYSARIQAAGVVFARDLASDYRARASRIAPLKHGFPDEQRTCASLERPVSAARLRTICAPGGPGTVILPVAVPGFTGTPFLSPAPRPNGCWRGKTLSSVEISRFVAYDCAAVRGTS